LRDGTERVSERGRRIRCGDVRVYRMMMKRVERGEEEGG
jgi:hypothetical protein